MILWKWVKDYWKIPILIVTGVAAFMLFRKGKDTGALHGMQLEMSAVAAQREARDLREQAGLEVAKKHVLDKYKEKRELLDEKQEARVKELEDDPEALAKALERLTRT